MSACKHQNQERKCDRYVVSAVDYSCARNLMLQYNHFLRLIKYICTELPAYFCLEHQNNETVIFLYYFDILTA